MTKQEKQKLFIGIGVGLTVGIGTGYLIGAKTTKRKAREEIKRVRRNAYMKGIEEATEEAKKFIDDNVIVVDSSNSEEIQKAVEAHFNALSDGVTRSQLYSAEAVNGAFLGQTEAFCEDKSGSSEEKATDDNIYAEKEEKNAQNNSSQYDLPDELNFIGVSYDGTNIIFANGDEPPLTYPKWLFLNNNGEMRDVINIREDLKRYDHTIRNLCVVWNRLGWGTYVMDLDGANEDEDISSYDVNIDDTTLGEEPMEKTIARQKYLDEIDRYQAHPEEAPHFISRQDFEEEAYLDQRYFDYYEVDNVFVESNDTDKPVDAYSLFGTTNGQELFDRKNSYLEDIDHGLSTPDDDPDIVHLKNFKMNSVMEVTRWHKSYESVRDGSAYIHGSPD